MPQDICGDQMTLLWCWFFSITFYRSPDYSTNTLPCQAFSQGYSVTFSYRETEFVPLFRNTAEKIRGQSMSMLRVGSIYQWLRLVFWICRRGGGVLLCHYLACCPFLQCNNWFVYISMYLPTTIATELVLA